MLCTAAPAFAADTSVNADDQRAIVVTGERQKSADATSTATRTNTAIKDIPQALTVVSSAQIADRQLRSVADLLNFVPGASYGSGEGNRDQIVLRGNSSTADFFVDGVRDDVQYFRDFYNVERVEVLKGPNAMIFGRGGGGGIVNRVLKRPSFNAARAHRRFGRRLGRAPPDDRSRPAAVPRDRSAPQRLYEDSDSFRRHVDLKRYGINPTAALLVGPDTGSTCRTNISTTAAPPTAASPLTATNRSGASGGRFSAIRASAIRKRT